MTPNDFVRRFLGLLPQENYNEDTLKLFANVVDTTKDGCVRRGPNLKPTLRQSLKASLRPSLKQSLKASLRVRLSLKPESSVMARPATEFKA